MGPGRDSPFQRCWSRNRHLPGERGAAAPNGNLLRQEPPPGSDVAGGRHPGRVLLPSAPQRSAYHGTEVHGLNGIFLSSVGRWIRLDARGNTGAINAQFSLDQEQLAFPVDPTRGEYTDETIYAEPLPVVINCLRRFTTRSEMWPHLPESLDLPCPDSVPDC